MIYSLANLLVVRAAGDGSDRKSLDAVHFAEDGTTVASDGYSFLAVSPVNKAIRFPDVGELKEPGPEGFSLAPNVVEQAIRNLPRGRPEMGFAALTANVRGRAELTSTDLRQEQRIAGAKRDSRFPDWQKALRHAARDATVTRVCLDRRRLLTMLKTLDEASGGSENPVVFLEIGGELDPVLMRSENKTTGQRIVGMMTPMDTKGKWLRPSSWEREVVGRDAKRRKS